MGELQIYNNQARKSREMNNIEFLYDAVEVCCC